jgi:hypothetical protein
MRSKVPSAILFVIGLIMILERFTTVPVFAKVGGELRGWGILIAAFALGVSAVNLILVHVRNIETRRNLIYSFVLLIAMAFTILLGLFSGVDSTAYKFWYKSFLTPMSTAMYAMLAYYLTSAAFRSFVARNTEATVLLIVAVLVMIGNVPIGEMLYSDYGTIYSWIFDVPNLAGQRGVMIAAAIGSVVVSLRVLIGIDRSHFGGI